MTTIEILHDEYYRSTSFKSGFEAVQFPALVQAKPCTYGDNDEYVLEGAYHVPLSELVRIGYTGPALESLYFSEHLGSARKVNPFTYWNQLKASRPVGPIGQPLPVPRPVLLVPSPLDGVTF